MKTIEQDEHIPAVGELGEARNNVFGLGGFADSYQCKRDVS